MHGRNPWGHAHALSRGYGRVARHDPRNRDALARDTFTSVVDHRYGERSHFPHDFLPLHPQVTRGSRAILVAATQRSFIFMSTNYVASLLIASLSRTSSLGGLNVVFIKNILHLRFYIFRNAMLRSGILRRAYSATRTWFHLHGRSFSLWLKHGCFAEKQGGARGDPIVG